MSRFKGPRAPGAPKPAPRVEDVVDPVEAVSKALELAAAGSLVAPPRLAVCAGELAIAFREYEGARNLVLAAAIRDAGLG